MDIALVIAALLGGGAMGSLLNNIFGKKKSGAEADELSAKATDIITKTAVELLERTTALANARELKLEAKITTLEQRLDHLSTVVDTLTSQLETHGIEPIIVNINPLNNT